MCLYILEIMAVSNIIQYISTESTKTRGDIAGAKCRVTVFV